MLSTNFFKKITIHMNSMSEFNSLCTEEEKQLEAALNLPAF
jgi:hypothetical protein